MRVSWLLKLLLVAAVPLAGCVGGPSDQAPATPPAVTETPGGASSGQGAGNGEAGKPPSAGEAQGIPYRAEVFVRQLNVPWDMAFAPDGRIFVTERPGAVRVIEDGQLQPEPVYVPEPPFVTRGESGLLGITLDPDFETNRYLYVYHTYEEQGEMRNRVLRLVEKNGRAEPDRVLLAGLPGQRTHDGGRIRFGPDGKLYVTVGDAQDPSLSQSLDSMAGKILRLNIDGTVPNDNPYPGSYVYSWGHRNPQGLAWHPETGGLFSSEHGQSAHDEINWIEPGVNYGWPVIQGDEPGSDPNVPMRTPLAHSGQTTWAPSGIAFITQGPWKNQLLAANLRGMQLLRIELNEDSRSIKTMEPLFREEYGRLRSVAEGPDGSLYLLTNNRDGRGVPDQQDDRIIRLQPIP